jgi:glycosyltransferase involved in cell wall biosynthesis
LNFGSESIVFVSDIYAVDVLKDIKYSKLVYDCCDEVAEFSSSYKEVATKNENYLIENANVLFCSAKNLYDRLILKNPNVHIVRNAAEYEHFANAVCNNGHGIGFVGAVADWINIDIIQYLAENLPEEQLHIIGPVSVNVDEIRKLDNVKFYGKQDYANLPELLKNFNVAIAPFKINSLTLSVNPIKFYEYCSAEKITVATRLPELEAYEPHIFIADTKEEFLEKVKIALAVEDENFIMQIKAIGKSNSWEARGKIIDTVLNRL